MLDNLLLIPNWAYWFKSNSYLLATVTEGENYAKILTVSLALIGLSIFILSCFFREISARTGLPLVIGNLIVGLVIGLSGLHILVPEGAQINPVLVNIIEFVQLTQ